MKEFTTALRAVTEDEDQGFDFSLDGHELKAYKPTDGQFAMVMAAMGRHTSESTKLAGIIDFFMAVMDNDSAGYLADRLLERSDPFGLPEIEAIMTWLVEEWTGHPTQPLSVSTQ